MKSMSSPTLAAAFRLLLALVALPCLQAHAQRIEQIAIPAAGRPVRSGHLNMGGTAPGGHSLDINSFYISRDGRPCIPVTGEFHYSRYPAAQWEQEIAKMRAGGITVLPTYVFWNLHEPREGQFRWDGNLDLRHFIELCQKHGMDVIVRIGPFAHGEMRNGGLPDWLFAKNLDIRSDDADYLALVGRLYKEIAAQLRGLYFKDGGPIIGCQIENEHQHSAAPNAINYPGEPADYTSASYDKAATHAGVSVSGGTALAAKGERHLRTLLAMAKQAGIITPLYTATGWGMAAVPGCDALPVTAAYTYPMWEEPQPSPFCLFKDQQAEPDYAPVRYNPLDFPAAAAEMGVGMQNAYRRRPIVCAEAAEALMVRTLGGGSNVIGYYMYHGGSTPAADGGWLSDEPMGMPKISYDYQAPLGEFGREQRSYRALRLIHSFIDAFGDRLAPMTTTLPANAATLTPANRDSLRWAVRSKDGSGFVFLVNFQDHDTLRHDMAGLTLRLRFPAETIDIGPLCLPKDASAILPVNMDLDGARLQWATAQPLTRIDDGGTPHYFFFAPAPGPVRYCFGGKVRTVRPGLASTFSVAAGGGRVRITTLTRAQALDAMRIGGRLLITSATAFRCGKGLRLTQLADTAFSYIIYPSAKGFHWQHKAVPSAHATCAADGHVPQRLSLRPSLPEAPAVNEWFLRLPYTGDIAHLFIGGRLALDHFWFGQPWVIGLARFGKAIASGEPLYFYIRPLYPGAPFLGDVPAADRPDLGGGSIARYGQAEIVPEYKTDIDL